jgi:hypothetical protein
VTSSALRRVYYPVRLALARAADRVVEWADLQTRRAYRLKSTRVQKQARHLLQTLGGCARTCSLLPRVDRWMMTSGQGTVIYLGDALLLNELQALLGTDTCLHIDRVAAWNVPAAVARSLNGADLVVCGLPAGWPSRWRSPSAPSFTVPIFVAFDLPLIDPIDDWVRAHATRRFRQEVAAAGVVFQGRISGDRAVFEQFYEEMYLPHVRRRHGARALISPSARQWQDWLHPNGELLLVSHDGIDIGGVLLAYAGETCFLGEEGVSPDPALDTWSRHAQLALKRHAAERARGRGCKRLHLGRSLAQARDGGFRSKQRWGATVTHPERSLYPEWTFIWRQPGAMVDRLDAAALISVTSQGARVASIREGRPQWLPLPER